MSPGHSCLEVLTEGSLREDISWEEGLAIYFLFLHPDEWEVRVKHTVVLIEFCVGDLIRLLFGRLGFIETVVFLFSDLEDLFSENLTANQRHDFSLLDTYVLIFEEFNLRLMNFLLADSFRHLSDVVSTIVELSIIIRMVQFIDYFIEISYIS